MTGKTVGKSIGTGIDEIAHDLASIVRAVSFPIGRPDYVDMRDVLI